MRIVKVAATQMSCTDNIDKNIAKAEDMVRKAAEQGAQIILLQNYLRLCISARKKYRSIIITLKKYLKIRQSIILKDSKRTGSCTPYQLYEKKNNARYNALAVIDADGEVLGVYRKSHIPDGPGYEEKYYFNPGDTSLRCGIQDLVKLGLESAGISGIRKQQDVWHLWERKFYSILRQSDLNRKVQRLILKITGRGV